ncbi:MAG: cupin domain-containing protein [Methyloligellaceae bacterium]
MSDKKTAEQYVIRTRELNPDEATHIQHPLNPDSDVRMHPISAFAGMQRLHMHYVRVPAGKESYTPHAQTLQEEYVFIIEGNGTLDINGEQTPIGPGDYIGFPTDGAAHHILNTGTEDLVYLSAGERTDVEVVDLPTHNKIGVFTGRAVQFFDKDSAQSLSLKDFVRQKP